MPPRFEDLDLDAQLDMPVTMKRELLARPATHRGVDATDLAGNACTKYFRRVNPANGRTEWASIPGANCSVAALTPKAAAAPRLSTGAVTVCGTAGVFLSQIALWSSAQAGNPAFVTRFVTDWRRNLTGAFELCERDVDLVDQEINRLLIAFGGSRNLVPVQIKVPVQLLADLLTIRASRYTPRDQPERARLNAGGLVTPPNTGQSIRQTTGRTDPAAVADTPPPPTHTGFRLG